ncbi:MAG: 2-succinyl-5-enolpyruvyl-6-hydroxy-3-cyclohexene-1-carboxylic-acid synthase [Bacteroidales bacterium]|nr:2-succinyl-5-enolpyruvyl-6-hydroxy-3-cyclohexene-1-carboxylic-acid synthase [Bacteroidales bacterium]
MFCDKPSVNQLTALMLAHGVHHVVVCPGSRNAAIVHNFAVCETQGKMTLYPVTDERSAAFVAIGIALAVNAPVAICVTSGSALLNTLPAVAEAYYRHLPLLIISADRPEEWIGQLDGQTLPQRNALMPYAPTFQLTEDNLAWNNRMLNEALCRLHKPCSEMAHLNVPLSEPLFSFSTPSLPTERVVKAFWPKVENPLPTEIVDAVAMARCPMLYLGQYESGILPEVAQLDAQNALLVMAEPISQQHLTEHLSLLDLPNFHPDLIIHAGGNTVDKRLRLFLRSCEAKVIRLEEGTDFVDTLSHLDSIVYTPLQTALRQLLSLPANANVAKLKEQCKATPHSKPLVWNEECAVSLLRQSVKDKEVVFHLANSQSVRLYKGNVATTAQQKVYCNRGVNGIEGSLSAAVGYALASQMVNYCIIGDLSFFYDGNALWNQQLKGNLRVLLLNNGGGRIFDHLPGLSASMAQGPYVSANHHTSAEGLCQSHGAHYLVAHSEEEYIRLLPQFTTEESDRPMVLEVSF